MYQPSPIIVSLLLFIAIPLHASERHIDADALADRIVKLKVLTESSAIVVTDRRVLVTDDEGRQWRETFTAASANKILTADFHDISTAWVLVSNGGDITVWRTTNGGDRWNATLLPGGSDEGATSGSFSFSDDLNGYLMVRLPSSSNWSRGRLFRTHDGGLHWNELSIPPIAGSIAFISEERGWLTGGPAGTDFFETRDSGASWSRVTLPNIVVDSDDVPVRLHAELPSFGDTRNGVLAVTRETPHGSSLLMYGTTDEGASWRLTRTLDFQTSGVHAVAAADGLVLTANVDMTRARVVTELADPIDVRDAAKGLPSGLYVSLLSLRATHGLAAAASSTETWLFYTRDGGHTFADVTPAVLKPEHSSRKIAENKIASDSVIQQNKDGFDKACYPTTAQMQTWWNAGTYKYIGTYIGGRHAYCINHSSTCPCPPASWFSSTSAQGWTFIPIWVGVQEKYGTLSTSSTTTAFNQGVSEADAAADRMSALGFPQGNIVYFDFEQPHPLSTQPYVQAFISGWVSRLRTRGHDAGIYGSYLSAEAWGNGSVTSPPAAIWPYNLNSPYRTVFGLCGPNYCLPDNIWNNHQRIRQYSQNIADNQGGISLIIDKNYADGPTASLAASANPSVTLTTRQISSNSVTVNQSFTVSTTLRVNDAAAEHAGISISFPSLTNPGTSGASYNSTQGSVQTNFISSGATQLYLDNYPSHLLAEADWSNVSAGASKTFNLTVTPKTSGTFKVRIRAWVTKNGYASAWRDPNSGTADQQGYWTYEYPVTVANVDTTSPTIAITSPTSNSTYNASVSPLSLGGTASDNIGVTQVTCRNAATGNTVTANGTTAWTCSVSLLPGGNAITVTARDGANNTSTDTITVTYVAPDTAPPTVAITSPTSGTTYSSESTPITLGGTASDNIGVTQVTCQNTATGTTVTANGTTAWSCSVSLLAGTNAITVTATDAANNTSTDTINVAYSPAGSGGLSLYLVPPCRLLDTRSLFPLESGVQYSVQITGACGIPQSAVSVVANITVITPSDMGWLVIWPYNLSKPGTSNINFRRNRTRANNAILMLATDGYGDVRVETNVNNNGALHLVIDVQGYFQ